MENAIQFQPALGAQIAARTLNFHLRKRKASLLLTKESIGSPGMRARGFLSGNGRTPGNYQGKEHTAEVWFGVPASTRPRTIPMRSRGKQAAWPMPFRQGGVRGFGWACGGRTIKFRKRLGKELSWGLAELCDLPAASSNERLWMRLSSHLHITRRGCPDGRMAAYWCTKMTSTSGGRNISVVKSG